MNFFNLNISLSKRLGISAASFLLPLIIMLIYIMSLSFSSINKNKTELDGIKILRPAIMLMRSIPQFVNSSFDGAGGDTETAKQSITQLFNELEQDYHKLFKDEDSASFLQRTVYTWNFLSNSTASNTSSSSIQNTYLNSYLEIMKSLKIIISNIGDKSGLITDSEESNSYLISAIVHELPQAQERMVIINNLLRMIRSGDSSPQIIDELKLNINILAHSENDIIQRRFNSIETLGLNIINDNVTFDYILNNCYNNILHFSNLSYGLFSSPRIDREAIAVLLSSSNQANNSAFRLQSATLDYLEENISSRIKSLTNNLLIFTVSIIAVTFFVFFIVVSTLKYINNSTKEIGHVFKKLDENDLTVQLDVKTNDEFGDLMRALNGFLIKLNEAFVSFSKSANMVTTSVMELSSSSLEISATANEQSSSVAEIVATMESNKELSAQSSENTLQVASLALKTQELSHRGAELRNANESMMLEILNQNTKIIEIINNLADMIMRIDESIQLIDSIADRTKLIAFNAALEASSAGEESGSRFSVVAGEIRRFADNVVESVVEIKEKITELQEASKMLITEANNGSSTINNGYKKMVEQKEVFANIVSVSENVANRSQQISNLSKQQEMASTQVFTALKEISAGVNQFVSTTQATRSAIDKLNSMSIELEETILKYKIKSEDTL